MTDIKILLAVKFNEQSDPWGYRVGELVFVDEDKNVHLICGGEEVIAPHTDIIEEGIIYETNP